MTFDPESLISKGFFSVNNNLIVVSSDSVFYLHVCFQYFALLLFEILCLYKDIFLGAVANALCLVAISFS